MIGRRSGGGSEVGWYRRGEDRGRERGKEGISLMFLAANQLRSQGYPGFANSHGKGGVLRAERRGGRAVGKGGAVDEGSRWKRGGRDGCPFFSPLSPAFLREGGQCSGVE